MAAGGGGGGVRGIPQAAERLGLPRGRQGRAGAVVRRVCRAGGHHRVSGGQRLCRPPHRAGTGYDRSGRGAAQG